VKLSIDSQKGLLKQGMFTKIKLVVGEKKGFIVPKKAIILEELYTYVVILEKKEMEIIENGEKIKKEVLVSRRVRVEEGYVNGKMQEIMGEDLKEGVQVVIDGQYSLEDNDIVKIK
jgi:multidrug efflux pump subunit AcrA (membrane-fusion protein)